LFALCAISALFLSTGASAQATRPGSKFVPVQPVKSNSGGPSASSSAPGSALQIGTGRFFSYAMPQGWRLGEDGQFALTLVAPDNKALTIMVGNAGLPLNYPAARFISDKLSAMRPQNLQIGPPRQARPVNGFAQAFEFDVSYSSQGIDFRGVAKCNVQPAYDSALMAMTAAIAEARQWPGYATWLPQVAAQISATNGAAFGARGVMAQNLRNSQEFGEAAHNYREWSQKNQQGVTDARNASQDKTNAGMRDILGGTQPYLNPYGGVAVEMPLTYRYYWSDRQGHYVGTDDPSANPNVGSTDDWRPLKKAN